LFLFGAIWLILQQKSMSLEREISQGFLFTLHRVKNLAISGFFVNKTGILSAKTAS